MECARSRLLEVEPSGCIWKVNGTRFDHRDAYISGSSPDCVKGERSEVVEQGGAVKGACKAVIPIVEEK